jgi:hypothetical protein
MKELGVNNLEVWLRNRCRRLSDGGDLELAEGFYRLKLP